MELAPIRKRTDTGNAVLRAARCPVLIYSRSAGESMGRTSQEETVPRSRRAASGQATT